MSPGNKAALTFARKHKRIPAALKEVTDAPMVACMDNHLMHNNNNYYFCLPGVGEHKLLHEWVPAEVKGQQKELEEAVVCHQRQGLVHIRRERGQPSRQSFPHINGVITSNASALWCPPHRTWLP